MKSLRGVKVPLALPPALSVPLTGSTLQNPLPIVATPDHAPAACARHHPRIVVCLFARAHEGAPLRSDAGGIPVSGGRAFALTLCDWKFEPLSRTYA
jgi:hypothetical protein